MDSDAMVCCGCGITIDHGVCSFCRSVTLRQMRYASSAGDHSGTPLISSRLGPDLYLKYEGANVTGTFKDRIMDLLVHETLRRGASAAVVASSGNAAVAAAAAATRQDLPLLAFVPTSIPAHKRAAIAIRGSAIVEYGENPAEVYALARMVAERLGFAELASTFRSTGAEFACRAIGHEVVQQLGDAPVAVSAAISVGPVLVGTGMGIEERTGHRPVLLGGQAAGCAPIAAAYMRGATFVEPWSAPISTKATSIADPLAQYAHEASFCLEQVNASGGRVTAWTDEELAAAQHRLLRWDGVGVELASAAALLAAEAWEGSGPVVAVLTGGLPSTVPNTYDETSLAEFAERVGATELTEVIQSCVRTLRS